MHQNLQQHSAVLSVIARLFCYKFQLLKFWIRKRTKNRWWWRSKGDS